MALIVKPYTFVNGPGNVIDGPQVNSDLDTLYALVNGQLEPVNLKAGSGLFDSYKEIDRVTGDALSYSVNAAGIYFFNNWDAAKSGAPTTNVPTGLIDFRSADYALTGKTLKMQLRAVVMANGTSLGGVTIKPGLYPLSSVAGGADSVSFTLGAVVAGSDGGSVAPATNSINRITSGDFSVPADGAYLLGFNASGAIPPAAATALALQLLIRGV